MMDFLRQSLDPPWADDEIRIVTIPAPDGEPERLLTGADAGPAFFWHPTDGPAIAGIGAAAVIRGQGPNRGVAVASAAARLWSRLRRSAVGDSRPVPARVFGGLAFGPGTPPRRWADFGEGTFVLPRVLYGAHPGSAYLTIAVTGQELRRDGPDRAVRDACAALDRVVAGPEPARPAPGHRLAGARGGSTAGDDADADAWAMAVASIQQRIAAGRADKIVAARARRLRFDTPPDPAAVLRRLATTTAAARFSLRFGTATFLGAAPERLVCRSGPAIRSEAVAGSMPAGRANRPEDLLDSTKDTMEHGFVVRAIADTLGPLCDRLEYADRPHVHQVGPVLHLRTSFTGTLAVPVPALELALRLHPTPAVGGTPTHEALDWIAREEQTGRGWYAAPVGWFDQQGDGDFVVALRCALLDGDEALLYAGAGIVGESSAGAEFSETELKLQTMLSALEVEP